MMLACIRGYYGEIKYVVVHNKSVGLNQGDTKDHNNNPIL